MNVSGSTFCSCCLGLIVAASLLVGGCKPDYGSGMEDAIYTPVFRHNLEHTGVYPAAGVRSGLYNRWTFKTDGAVRGAPVLASGELYFGSGDGYLYSIDEAQGKLQWKFKTGGAVHASPAVGGNVLYITSRDRRIYAVDRETGREIWRTQTGDLLPLPWGFDYYLSSPVVNGETVYAGAGDGFLYALNRSDGSVRWKLQTGGRVRSALTIHGNMGYIGNLNGHFYAIDLQTGQAEWSFDIEGAALDAADFGFDRSGILSTAVYAEGRIVFGGRDGYVYCLDAATGEQLWRNNHEVSWAVSSMAYYEGKIITGTSDGRFVQAIELESGEEIWRTRTEGAVWSSPAVANGVAYFGDSASNIFAVETETGEVVWNYLAGGDVWASPVVKDSTVFIGSDDGAMYALAGSPAPPRFDDPARAVYTDPEGSTPMLARVSEALAGEGYLEIDTPGDLNRYFSRHASPDSSSVVVMAVTSANPTLFVNSVTESPLKRYLQQGGKIVWLGRLPFLVRTEDQETLAAENERIFKELLGIGYHFDLRGHLGIMPARVTDTGGRWGLQTGWWVGSWPLDPNKATEVLARDEYGNAAAWNIQFTDRAGTGYVRLPHAERVLEHITGIKAVAEYGLDR